MENFKDFFELRDYLRRYNALSILEAGTRVCWENWREEYETSLSWVGSNMRRNYALRLMLLASSGNYYRNKNITSQDFQDLLQTYYSWEHHTISDSSVLDLEADYIFRGIKDWEEKNNKKSRNWSIKLSQLLSLDAIRQHTAGLFLQRTVVLQNSSYGKPIHRLSRSIKILEHLSRNSQHNFLEVFKGNTGVEAPVYFRQFFACLDICGRLSSDSGLIRKDFFPEVKESLSGIGITKGSVMSFVQMNSATFSSQSQASFRNRVADALAQTPTYYHPFLENTFLDTPFIQLPKENYLLPDPISLTESCWNQIEERILGSKKIKAPDELLGEAFEAYVCNTLLPALCTESSFHKIPEVSSAQGRKDKRADFLIETESFYIIIECKKSIMSSKVSAYFPANELAISWCRIHHAVEQISATIEGIGLLGKPIVPVIITFYDSMAASAVYREMLKSTEYYKKQFSTAPLIYGIHEFEHETSKQSLESWAKNILAKETSFLGISSDKKGHEYSHFSDIEII